jgi:two-component system, NtrC family, sensor kinase
MRLSRTIAFRLFLLLASVQLVILLALTYATIRVQQDSLMQSVTTSAIRVSDVIARSTRYSMLLNRKEDVQKIVLSLRGEPGISGVRIYNKQGEAVFATVESDIGTKVDVTAEACVSCHGKEGLETPKTQELSRIFTTSMGDRVLGQITPIRNEEQCSNADCHAHPPSKTILGVVDVKMTLTVVDEHLAKARNTLLSLSAAAVLLVGFVSGVFTWFVVRRPVKRLMAGMEMVSSGRLDLRVDANSRDELGQLARTFNTMTEDLARARAEITSWSQTLEQKVREKTADLERAHRQMVHVEKMASLGSLASSVAHELNNPLEGILTFAKLIVKRLQKSGLSPEEKETYGQELKLIADEAARCGTIVKNLLVFSRHKAVSIQKARMRTILERCVLLVNHHAAMNNVTLTTSCTDDDEIECDPGQLQQLLIALMMNAIEAMPLAEKNAPQGQVTVEITSSNHGRSMQIRVKDTGTGMTDDVRAHIFEPFFTTKSEGKGVGLGLAIAYGIVERHGGEIEVQSSPGKGTQFIVTLPTKQPAEGTRSESLAPHEGAQS